MTLTIDGSQGEGGGQVLRTTLTLALVTGKPVVIENIRAGRKKPGLMRQHLTAVKAAAEIGRANVRWGGNRLPAAGLPPRPRRAGRYTFSVGTAGSTTLVLQTVLPALLLAGGESTLTLRGGTHNPLAPPLDFLTRAYLPLVNRMGPRVSVNPIRVRPRLLSGRRRHVSPPESSPPGNSGGWSWPSGARSAPTASRR